MKLSIIIPVLNEENSITKILDYLQHIINSDYVKEILVVDGGSIDKTLLLLESYPNVVVLNSKRVEQFK